ncbi:MAG: carboxypeptidase M32 [Alphaproteobacteria bacterium]
MKFLSDGYNKIEGNNMKSGESYARLEKIFDRINNLEEAELYLKWDRSAMMPPGGARRRTEHISEIRLVIAEMLSQPEVEEWLDEVEAEKSSFDEWQQANIREMRRLWLHTSSIPADLAREFSSVCSKTESLWYNAKKSGNFNDVMPTFGRLVDVIKEMATIKSEKFNLTKYEVLYDIFEPNGSEENLDHIFGDLEVFLPEFIEKVKVYQNQKNNGMKPQKPRGFFSETSQKNLGMRLMEAVGFDFNHGRVDPVMHPFCGGAPEDLRITTRYDTGDFTKNLTAVMHEVGHAIYKSDLPEKWRTQPVGKARGQGIHESQSLMLERFIVYSKEFMDFAKPLFKEYLNADNSPEWSTENLCRCYRWVEPSYIRIEADEVTYPLHIILRYKLEKALIYDQITTKDVPEFFNTNMKKLLGITPRNDKEGCLQDIHWYAGDFGYFPTYSLGAINTAQLFKAILKDYPDIMERIKKGDFLTLMSWLRDKVHRRASLLLKNDLIQEVTGENLNINHYKEYLTQRYLGDA